MTGCLAPEVKENFITLKEATKSGKVVEVVKILDDTEDECWVKDDNGKTYYAKVNLKDAKAIRPDIAKANGTVASRILYNKVYKVQLIDGSTDRMDLGGWHVISSSKEIP